MTDPLSQTRRVTLQQLQDQKVILLAKQQALANELKALNEQIWKEKQRGTFR